MLAQALPRVKADAGDLDARMDCQIGTWLSMGPLAAGVPMGASHGIGYVLGAVFDVPHGYTSCVMLPAVMRWNKPVNAERQALVSAAMGHPARTPATCWTVSSAASACRAACGRSESVPSISTASREQAMANAVGPAQPAQDRRPGAGARNS